jgi:hypothetical protein
MSLLNLKHFFTRSFLAALIVGSCTFYANAQTAAKPAAKTTAAKGAQSYIDSFFKKYKTSSDSAVDYLFGTNKLFTNTAQINLLKSKLDSLQLTVGKYLGHELISQKSASTSLVVYSYLVKNENQPLRFTFIFYKAKNDWALYRFNYDDQMDVELLNAVKIDNKRPQ